MLRVWSEREPGGMDECTEAAHLMVLLHGGQPAVVAGRYTDAERDALEAAIPDRADLEVGSTADIVDLGANRRYGVTLHRISEGSRAGLRRALRDPGQALSIAGSLGAFPAGHRLRRHQPDFTGGHRIAVVTLSNDRALWLDPLAPMRFEGDEVDIERVLEFAWLPSDARVARRLEFAGPRMQRLLRRAREDLTDAAAQLRAMADELDD